MTIDHQQQGEVFGGIHTNRTNEITDEYHAVTLGEKNEDGIYESPTKILSEKIAAIIAGEIGRGRGLDDEKELEI